MKLKFSQLKGLLQNKYVLQATFVISIFYVIGLLSAQRWENLMLYVVLCILFYSFTKNMIVVLGVPLLLVNVLLLMRMTKEGLENRSANANDKNNVKNANDKNNSKNANDAKNNAKNVVAAKAKANALKNSNTSADTTDDTAMVSSTSTSAEAFDGKKNNKKRGSYELDYASTLENAYDDLNKILGSDGMQNLTADTKGLMEQQMKLAESMKSMEPFIKNMSPLIQQFGQMFDKQGGLGNLLKPPQ